MQIPSKLKKPLLIAAAIIGSASVIFLIVLLWPGNGQENKSAYSFIPKESAVVIRFNDGGAFADSLLCNKKTPIPIDLLPVIAEWKNLYNSIDQSYSRSGNPVRDWIRNGCWYLSLTNVNGITQVLFIREFNEDEDEQFILTNLLHGAYKNDIIKDQEDGFYELQDSLGHKLIFTICDETFIGSFDAAALQHSMDVHKSGSNLEKNSGFCEALRVADKQSLFNIFVHFEPFKLLIEKSFKPEHAENLGFLSKLGEWAELDVYTISEGLAFSGLFSIKNQENSAMKLFEDQAVSEINYAEVLPDNIIYMIRFSFDNFEGFTNNYLAQFEPLDVESIQNTDSIRAIFGNSFARFALSDNKGALIHYGAFSLNDSVLFDELQISKILNHHNEPLQDDVFRGLKIHDIDLTDICPIMGGQLFKNCQTGCWVLYKDHILFAPDQAKMELLLNRLLSGKTLQNASYFAALSDKLSAHASVTIILSPASNPSIVPQWWFENATAGLWQTSSVNASIQAIGLSITMDGDRCLLSGAVTFGQGNKDQNNGWQTKVDEEISSGPWILKYNDAYYIMVQDAYNNLYLISDQGEVIWKNGIDEQVEGKVYAISNGNDQAFTFATSHQIILMNLKGEIIKPFPLIINEGLSSGLLLVDYEKNKQYRLMAVSKNGNMLNYQTDGKPTAGWKTPKTKHRIGIHLQHVKLKGTDYLVLNDAEGNLSLITRTGKLQFSTNNLHGSKSGSQIGNSDQEGLLYTSDIGGNIISISPDGKKTVVVPGTYSINHCFSAADIDNDGILEFIIVDEGVINIIKKDGKIVFKQNITKSVVSSVQIDKSNSHTLIMIHAQNGDVILLNGLQIEDWFSDENYPNGAAIVVNKNSIHLVGASGDLVYHLSND